MESPLCPDLTPPAGLQIVETFRLCPDGTIPRWHLHRARMAETAGKLGFPFDDKRLAGVLPKPAAAALRVRVTLDAVGEYRATAVPLPPDPPLWSVRIAAERVASQDPWLRFKTTWRSRYDDARAALPAGVDEWLFMNETGALSEGTITNIFVERDGILLTPPVTAGVLPGVLRRELLERRQAVEATLVPDDLRDATAIFVGNSLRGLIRCKLG